MLQMRKKGHWSSACKSTSPTMSCNTSAMFCNSTASNASNNGTFSLSSSMVNAQIGNDSYAALCDTGSSHSYIHPEVVKNMNVKLFKTKGGSVTMASSDFVSSVSFYCFINMEINGKMYYNNKFYVMENICVRVILGLDFLKRHSRVVLEFGGKDDSFHIKSCCLSTLKMQPPSLFANLTEDCKPIATKSRRYSATDKAFISKTVAELMQNKKVEPSNSPWRAQVLCVGGDGTHRRRMAVDYSMTINKFTLPDAYPLPKIDELTDRLAHYTYFSTLDLKSAYLQIPLLESEKQYTAFEADGCLYQYTVMPYGVTNGTSVFQRALDNFIKEENLKGVFAYLDNLHICGKSKEEHDFNYSKFVESAKKWNLTFNHDKSVICTTKLCTLGYVIEGGTKRPDPERLRPLIEMPVPASEKSLKRVLGLFSYYSTWIDKFSEKVAPLVNVKTFPLSNIEENAFHQIKLDIEKSVMVAIDENEQFSVECDASDIAISAVLTQKGRPVAFFSRTLNKSERQYPSVEKEACAVVEAVRKWKHYLTNKHFLLITDQKSVSFMFDKRHKNKIKNDKISRWRIELSCYHFDILHKPGKENIVPDTLTRMFIATTSYASSNPVKKLFELHDSLCHPGVTRLFHFIKTQNLPFSIDEVRSMTNNCRICQEIKPRFYKPANSHLIKATKPMERLSIDFKGPLPSNSSHKFILTIIDEYSRFPFAYPCKNTESDTVIRCLQDLFTLFGMPAYVHSDRGSSLISEKVVNYLHSKSVATSNTSRYNPQGNGQCEKLNGTIWRSCRLVLRSMNLPVSSWETVLPTVLHSIRTLLCTATNETPHERFFSYPRKCDSGVSLPKWLSEPGPVLLRRHVRHSKNDPLVEEVDLILANPNYAKVKFASGREATVSLRDLAPRGEELLDRVVPPACIDSNDVVSTDRCIPKINETLLNGKSLNPCLPKCTDFINKTLFPDQVKSLTEKQNNAVDSETVSTPTLRRSTRITQPPDRLVL